MLVRDVMTKRVVTVDSSETYSRMVNLLIKEKISGFVVIGRGNKVVGVISEKDFLYKLFPSQKRFYKNPEYYMNYENILKEAKKVTKLKAKSFMSKKIISIGPNESIIKACSIFLIHGIRRLPVIDDGKLVGIVTTNDIYKNFLSTLVNSN
jgi:CBS domain-containing protein